jgi:hypothetical protein
MRRNRRLTLLGLGTSAAMIAALALPSGSATAEPGDHGKPSPAKGRGGDVENVGPDYNQGKKLPLDKKSLATARRQAQQQNARQADGDAEVGDNKKWLALNDNTGGIYAKTYTMRGLGDHIQVWVADDRAFPAGDCRNAFGATAITDAQVGSFVHEFDANIYPKESESFSVPPSRDGADAPLAGALGEPADYYQVSGDQADDIVVLVDNVKDANYNDPSTPDGQTYIAGFFYSVFNEYVNRNVMTIDAFDWLHRTGANPPDDSANPAYTTCSQSQGQSRPYGAPRPHLYEGTFAHEYQHLLEYYEDPDELSWVNEGLSDYAQSLVGYVDTSIPPDQAAADSHIKCFTGFQPPSFGGPENSLTLWQDQGAPEILCDYGAAYSFMMYLFSHYGEDFMSALHRQDGNGLQGLDTVLDQFGSKKSAMDTIHDWAATMALDAQLDKGRKLTGGNIRDFTAASLSAVINWANPQAYDSPGAPPNGADYVRLRDGSGNPLRAKDLRSISFKGATSLTPTPVEWTTDTTPPAGTTAGTTCGSVGAGTGPTALYSGCGENLDRSIVRQVSVPQAGGQLSFQTLYDTEVGWDYGFAQVSTDGGKTWKSLATEDTTSDHDPGAIPAVVDNLPGLTGDSTSWRTEHADLTPYAGKDVLLGFRYITDSGVNEAGFWVRDINVAGTAVPASLSGWQTISQVNPTPVSGYTVQLVGYDAKGRSWISRLRLGPDFSGSLSGAQLDRALGKQATTVAAVVMFDDPSEGATQYARYTLKVNGVTQPGG